jgi:2-polyprenyl-3-methyl-5-hydroxy-6-metoxy-1,4-benzoquinol methylase
MSYDLWGRFRYMLSPQFDIYEQISEIVHGEVLDIGSGTGFGTHLFTRNASYVTGYEIDESALRFSQRTFSNGNLSFIHGNISALDKETKWFDFITMIDVIEHIREDKLAIQNCKRLLKEGGKFICSTPNQLSRYRKSEYHVREYSPKGLKALLQSVFNTVDILDFQLQPIESDYSNPIIGMCQC